MSLVKSHQHRLERNNIYEAHLSVEVIKEIVTFIINKHALLIVDIETKNANPDLLEQEIIRYLDKHKQFQMNRASVINQVMNYMFGYGILQDFINDEDVTDIDICRYNFIIIKRHGIKEITPLRFNDELEFTNFCKLIIIRNGGVINEHDCHARVADKKSRLRINVSIAPRNIMGSSMTIRKHRLIGYSLSDLMSLKMFDQDMEVFLSKIMKLSSRILIVGKGASGKTTLMRALLKEIPLTHRFLVCESDSELYPENPNFIVQKVRKSEDKKEQLSTLIKDGLTMSLDGYCIGELVGNEVYEFIKAGYTDHRIIGSLHAIGIEETLPRIISMMDKDLAYDLNDFIRKSIDLVIYMKKFKIMTIAQVQDLGFNVLYDYDIKLETNDRLEGVARKVGSLEGHLKDEMRRGLYDL